MPALFKLPDESIVQAFVQVDVTGQPTQSLQDDWLAITVTGVIRDITKDKIFIYGDGTSQTYYYDANGEFAGRSGRA